MGILSWLKKARQSKQKQHSLAAPEIEISETTLGFVLLSEPVLPELSDLQIDFQQFAPEGLVIEPGEDNSHEDDGEILSFQIKGVGTVFVMLMPMAIPNYESEAAREFSIGAYRNGTTLPQPHQAHLVITLIPEDNVEVMLKLSTFTAVLAAAVMASPANEVYWGNAGATHGADIFCQFAKDGKGDPAVLIMLWNGLSRAMEEDGRISFLSLGMHQLGLPNLFLIAPKDRYGDAFEWTWDLLNYLVEKGEALPAGDTVGLSAEHKSKVQYIPSPIGDGDLVWKVEM